MFVQFTFKNFKCFKEEAKISLIASNYDRNTREGENLIPVGKFNLKLLKSAIVYGANASGKTKLVEALGFMRHFVLNSSKEGQIDEPIGVKPFLLSSETVDEPSTFEIIFIHENIMYRYGFEADSEKIHSEWLYHKTKIKEVELFYRDFQDFEIHKRKFKVADLVENDRIRPNALLLSVAASWNDQLAKKIFDWFRTCNIISGLREEGYEGYSMARIQKKKENKSEAIRFLRSADLGIEDLNIKTLDFDNLPKEFPEALKEAIRKRRKENKEVEFLSDVVTYHKRFDSNNLSEDLVEFSMEDDESSGTKKYFALSGPVLETLKNGEILIVDELANKLHPNLTRKLIEVFNSKEKNPNNAQLIFNTHDTGLLRSGLFRRDQIWFTEKNRYGASILYSLSDFKGIRKEEDFEKNYVKGKYGAIPYLEDFENLFALN
ncbi:MAG TPA: ATP-binding protein [Bacteroidetes bacterium]|nr:ATP-binding protein [Bacteroidota bacterium]